jgi:hypothetical protein
MVSQPSVRTGQSCATDTREAVREFHEAVKQPDTALVFFFCSKAYDQDVLADEMARLFEGTQVMGCTTAGEIGPQGCLDHSISGASLPAGELAVATGHIDPSTPLRDWQGPGFVQSCSRSWRPTSPPLMPRTHSPCC